MDIKPGYRTTEFWLTAIVNMAGAIIAILAGRGLMTSDEGDLWLVLIQSIAVAIIPLALAIVDAAYIQSRGSVKTGG